jgi:methyl-accepting chemotaxis protein
MKKLLSQLSKILLKLNQVADHDLSTAGELAEYNEIAQKIYCDMDELSTILNEAEESLSNDMNTIIKLIANINEEFGDIVQEMQDIQEQLILVAQRYVKLKNITDD